MGIAPSEARKLSLWDYEAVLVEWNKLHNTNDDVEPASVEQFQQSEEFFADHPELLH